MLAHVIGIKNYEKGPPEVDTVLSKKSNLKRKVVNVLFLYFGCGLYLIDRPVVRSRPPVQRARRGDRARRDFTGSRPEPQHHRRRRRESSAVELVAARELRRRPRLSDRASDAADAIWPVERFSRTGLGKNGLAGERSRHFGLSTFV